MSLLAMPLLVVNLGSEMLYILDQRLKAQKIPSDKACKVITDVVKTMFEAQFVKELFAPQEMYTVAQTRQIFDKLAHSSIMKLSEASMDKLFDLMVMGVKYQLLCSTRVDQIFEITMTHVDAVMSLIGDLPTSMSAPPELVASATSLLTRVRTQISSTYKSLTLGSWHLLRQTLFRFFQDRRVKVSLFLQEGIQSAHGRIILPSPQSAYIGTVTYYDLLGGLEEQERLSLAVQKIEPVEFFCHPSALGENLYSKTRAKVVPPVRRSSTIRPADAGTTSSSTTSSSFSSATAAASASAAASVKRAYQAYRGVLDPVPSVAADGSQSSQAKEITLLSVLLNKSQNTGGDNFKLNLFGDDDFIETENDENSLDPSLNSFSSSAKATEANAAACQKPIRFTSDEVTKRAAHLEEVMKDLDLDNSAIHGKGMDKSGSKQSSLPLLGAEDLLDLMDQC